jgi:hypothetical protein
VNDKLVCPQDFLTPESGDPGARSGCRTSICLLSKFAAFEDIDALAAVRDSLLGAVISLAQLVDVLLKTNRAATYRAPGIGAAERKPTARQKH